MRVPLVQFRHYLRRWKPESRLTIVVRTEAGLVWRPPSTAEAKEILGEPSVSPSVALFTVSPYAVAKLRDVTIDDGEGAVASPSLLPAEPDRLRPFLEDVAGYFGTIKLHDDPDVEWSVRLLAVAPGKEGLYFPVARERRSALASSSDGQDRVRAVLVNLGAASVGLRWAAWPSTVDAVLDPSALTRVELEPNEGAIYSPLSLLVDIDTAESDAPVILLDAVSG